MKKYILMYLVFTICFGLGSCNDCKKCGVKIDDEFIEPTQKLCGDEIQKAKLTGIQCE